MKIREVNVNSLRITLPHTDAPGANSQHSRRSAEVLARSAANGLYEALRANGAGDVAVPELRVRLQRNRTSATDVARAIAEALRNIREKR